MIVLNVLNYLNDLNLLVLTRRQRPLFGHFLVQTYDIWVARQLADRGFHLLAGERRWTGGHQFLELGVKPRVLERLGHCAAQYRDDLLWRAGRDDVRPARIEKSAKQVDQLPLPIILAKVSNSGLFGRLGGRFPLGIEIEA